jgi:hypothetical protein
MPTRMPKSRGGEPLFDIASYGRIAREAGGRLTPAQMEQIRRTVQRAPEAVVKVLPRASNDLKAVGNHLNYIGRDGALELETDDGEHVSASSEKTLLDDWDLDIDDVRRQSALAATKGREPPKLVHKLMFSMPPGTPPEKVLGAVRNFARNEFWGQHRYAFALHTDEAHPHVHLVLKAVSEQGVRLNIRKATLRHWRSQFAHNLRLLGVEANATERAVRGEVGRRGRTTSIARTCGVNPRSSLPKPMPSSKSFLAEVSAPNPEIKSLPRLGTRSKQGGNRSQVCLQRMATRILPVTSGALWIKCHRLGRAGQ